MHDAMLSFFVTALLAPAFCLSCGHAPVKPRFHPGKAVEDARPHSWSWVADVCIKTGRAVNFFPLDFNHATSTNRDNFGTKADTGEKSGRVLRKEC